MSSLARRLRRSWQRRTARTGLLTFGVDEDFLSHRILPRAPRIELRPDEAADRLRRRLPERLKLLLPALNLSDLRPLPPFRTGLFDSLAAEGVKVVNRSVERIGKRFLQAELQRLGLPAVGAAREGDPDERLFVKSDWNSGGQPERLLSAAWRASLRLPDLPARVPERHAYSVVRRGDLDPALFDDPLLAVERYVERDDDLMLRVFVAGRHGVLFRILFEGQIKRLLKAREIRAFALERDADSFRASEPLDSFVPPILRDAARFCDGFGLEFGCLDIILDRADRGVIVDVNLTPYFGPLRDELGHFAHLRSGLLALTPR